MRTLNFAKRNFKEIVRDPLSIIFSILLPLFLLYIFQQFNIPSDEYKIENFTPGIIIFSFSFMTLFTASLVASDRSSSLISRLCASPMKSNEYIFGYALSVLPIVVIQNLLFFSAALLLGLPFNINILYTIIVSVLISILFITLGIIIGSVTSTKGAEGISSIIVQLVAFTSGMYFSADMAGNVFATICKIFPFSGSLNIIKTTLNNTSTDLLPSILIVCSYTIIAISVAIYVFNTKVMEKNK